MSRKERQRSNVLHQIQAKSLTLKEGAERMRVSYRQAKRIWRRFRREGESGLIHRSRGMPSNRRAEERFRQEALELYSERYRDFGPTLAAEKLAECHDIAVHRETLRRWLLDDHLWIGKTKARTHRRKRPRREHFGELVQMDGSHHRWFEERGEKTCLMVMIDDATGDSMALFAPEETTEAAFRMLKLWIERHGVPAALYVDRKSVYIIDREPTEKEKRLGTGPLTEFGWACWRLGIEIIPARSAQGKGRVERRNGLLQDRLVKELRLRGISDIASANAMLGEFCDSLDARFSRPAAAEANYHHALPEEPLEEILCWEVQRTVQNDWTVSYEGRPLQIERQAHLPRPATRVTVRRRLDGSLAIIQAGRHLRFCDPHGPLNANHLVTRPHGGGTTTPPKPQRRTPSQNP